MYTEQHEKEYVELGWGESSVGTQTIKLEDGKLYYRDMTYNEDQKRFEDVWVEIRQVNPNTNILKK